MLETATHFALCVQIKAMRLGERAFENQWGTSQPMLDEVSSVPGEGGRAP
ncbi:MAG: hypothetical protein ACFB01_08655 [Cohaesibacteraceae bacterium]